MTTGWRHPGRVTLAMAALLSVPALYGCNEDSASFTDIVTPPADPPAGGGSGSGNSAPTITGTPPSSVKIGDDYSFQPQASDPDGDGLTFSIEAKPAWASFDSATGALSGTPQAGDVGPYDNIAIAVSDGSASDSLVFSVAVHQVAMGSVTLSWTPPTKNSDGTELTDLAGFSVHYGVTEGQYGEEIQIDNPGLTTYVVDNLSPDTWYFVVTAVNSVGVESDFSGVAQVVVN